MENISSYKDLSLLITTVEKVKAELLKSIKDIQDYFNRIEGAKGYKTKTSYNDYDTIMSEHDTFASIGYERLLEEVHRLESMVYLQECNLERYYNIKKVMDECANQVTDVTVKVSMLRNLGMSQERVAELVERHVNTIQRMEKRERVKINGGLNGVV